jgi:hypothetical protein
MSFMSAACCEQPVDPHRGSPSMARTLGGACRSRSELRRPFPHGSAALRKDRPTPRTSGCRSRAYKINGNPTALGKNQNAI